VLLERQLGELSFGEPSAKSTQILFGMLAQFLFTTVGPLMAGALVLSVVTGLWQTGQNLTWQPLSPNLERLLPGRGRSRIFSVRTSVRLMVMLIKVAILTIVVAWTVQNHYREWFITPIREFEPLIGGLGGMAAKLSMVLVGCFFLVGAADFAFQRWKHEQDLMMSRHELKEDREEEGNSQVCAARRRRQRDIVRQQIERDVPKATVIVTNPTHFAVALRYERGKMSAPQVVAKGQDLVAQRIIAIASRTSIPVVRKPELARTLFKNVRVGKNVPSHLFRAVAEIIAHIYRARAQANSRFAPPAAPSVRPLADVRDPR